MHIPHACAYPIAGLKHEYQPPGYPDDHGFVPHGQSVIVTAPAAFRFTYEAAPERHHRAAELLAGEPLPDADEDTLPRPAARADARRRRADAACASSATTTSDIAALVEGALKQQRLLVVAPRRRARRTLGAILRASL